MQRSEMKNEYKLIKGFSQPIQKLSTLEKEESLKGDKNVKELKKFFSGFKRAMKFGLS